MQAELHHQRAKELWSLGRDEEGRAACVQALQQDPDHREVLLDLGRHLTAHRFYEGARTLLEHAVERHPQDPASHVALGLLCHKTGQDERARWAFERALQLDPNAQDAHTGLSFVLDRLGFAERADRHRELAYRNRHLIRLPCRGAKPLVRMLTMVATRGGNLPIERYLDAPDVETTLLLPEYFPAGEALPPHDLLFNAIGDADAVGPALEKARSLLASRRVGPGVINHPDKVLRTSRCDVGERLRSVPGARTARTATWPRNLLTAVGAAASLQRDGWTFPLLLRSPGYHGGEHFEKVDRPRDLARVAGTLPGDELIVMEFIDTAGADGKTRKYRVMMVDGSILPLHLAVGTRWKLHYFSAEMAGNAAHRQEDEAFLDDMQASIGTEAVRVLHDIGRALGLEYGGIDFAIDAQGRIVVFEANATMIVPPPEADTRWDYRRRAVARIDEAVLRMILDRGGIKSTAHC